MRAPHITCPRIWLAVLRLSEYGGEKGTVREPETGRKRRIWRRCISPHAAQNDTSRRSTLDRRATRHPRYAQSLRVRKRIEEGFGWAKTIGGLRRLRHRRFPNADFQFTLTFAAYNLVRLRHTWILEVIVVKLDRAA